MKFSLFGFMMLSACALSSTGLYAQNTSSVSTTIVDTSTNTSFPREVSFDVNGKKYQLNATGVATRKKLVFKVYSIAHYLQANAVPNSDIMQAIMSEQNAKQFTIKWQRDVSVDKVQEAYQESFHRVFQGAQYDQLKSQIDTFLKFFNQPAKKGEEYVIRWIPQGTIEVEMNGKKAGSIDNVDFARGVWSIWFGPNSIVNSQDLISQVNQNK